MTERNGVRVWLEEMHNGKLWALVNTVGPAPWAFHDHYDLIRAIGRCEVLKYSPRFGDDPDSPEAWERWTRKPAQFLAACFEFGDIGTEARQAQYNQLAKRFDLPR